VLELLIQCIAAILIGAGVGIAAALFKHGYKILTGEDDEYPKVDGF
jgi:hypothetical protein